MAVKDKIQGFVYRLYRENRGRELSKYEILTALDTTDLTPYEQALFEQIPSGRRYDEPGLIAALNVVIQRRGKEESFGGALEAEPAYAHKRE
jgi:hypothetical protein